MHIGNRRPSPETPPKLRYHAGQAIESHARATVHEDRGKGLPRGTGWGGSKAESTKSRGAMAPVTTGTPGIMPHGTSAHAKHYDSAAIEILDPLISLHTLLFFKSFGLL